MDNGSDVEFYVVCWFPGFLIHFKMAQWERLCNLPPQYRQQLDELYDKDVLPMEVRHYLAGWIEKQEW